MAGYINLGLRIFFGTIAGSLKIPSFVIGSVLRGNSPPPYSSEGIELGAALLRHVAPPSEEQGKDIVDQFKDVAIVAKDGVKLHAVVDTGHRRHKNKRPIVFVHGFPELWISWKDQLEYFTAAGHPVLALDMRGYGLSDKPKELERYHLTDCLVEDVRSAVKHAKEDAGGELAPLLVAHDWGASIAWSYVCQNQTMSDKEVSGYVSLAIPPLKSFEENMSLKQIWASLYMIYFNMPYLPEKVFLAGNAWMIGALLSDCKKAKLPTWLVNTYRANVLQNGAMEGQLNYYRSAIQNAPDPRDEDYGTSKRRLPLPALIVRGMDDVALSDDIFHGMDRYLEKFDVVELSNCSHWITADCPDEVNTEIDCFLDKL